MSTERPILAAERGHRLVDTYPHCDALVLHAPGECEFCDLPSNAPLHQERVRLGVRYTGQNGLDGWKCPSELRRPLETIEEWSGNRPETPETKRARSNWFSRVAYDATKKTKGRQPWRRSSEVNQALKAFSTTDPALDAKYAGTALDVSRSQYDLSQLLRKAVESYDAMTPLERLRHREEQRISFAYGNLAASTHHQVSLRQVRRAALEMWLDDLCSDDIVVQWKAADKLKRHLDALGFYRDSFWMSRGGRGDPK